MMERKSKEHYQKNSAEKSLLKSLSSLPLHINGNDTRNDATDEML